MRRFNFSLTILIAVFTAISFSSCGTILCSQKEVPAISITSSVPNAEVYLNDEYVGQTPYSHFGEECNIKKITVKKEGYKAQSKKPRKLTNWAYVNFFTISPTCGFIWGYFLDRGNSKCWSYKSDTFHFELEEENKRDTFQDKIDTFQVIIE